MKGREQEVPRAVAGEHPARPVGSMGGRRQADYQDPGTVVAEPGHGTTPVVLIPVGGSLLPGHLLAPCHQAGARTTGDDLFMYQGQGGQLLHGRRVG